MRRAARGKGHPKYPIIRNPVLEVSLRIDMLRAQRSDKADERAKAAKYYERAATIASFLGKPSADYLASKAADNLVLEAKRKGFVVRNRDVTFPQDRVTSVVDLLRHASELASPRDPQRASNLSHIASELQTTPDGLARMRRLDDARVMSSV